MPLLSAKSGKFDDVGGLTMDASSAPSPMTASVRRAMPGVGHIFLLHFSVTRQFGASHMTPTSYFYLGGKLTVVVCIFFQENLGEWINMTGFLCALGGVCVNAKDP